MPDQLTPLMGLDFWFSLAPLPWWSLTKVVFFALIGWTGAAWSASVPAGGWRALVRFVSLVNVGLAVFNAMLLAHNDAVGRCLIVLQSVY